MKNAGEITHLVFVKGIDIQLDNEKQFQQALSNNRRVAQQYSKVLVPVETNVRFFGHSFKPMGWAMYHGSGLASIVLALGLRKFFVAASHTFDRLFPWGCNPLTDPICPVTARKLCMTALRRHELRSCGGLSMCRLFSTACVFAGWMQVQLWPV
jgi:hypothetical protein